ncbi:hypothetical protein BKA66DRAFT_76534 [Pyrenochaeta sp. MPI-SDFR-AT-0127]|nr:hypothetical protein BKA66DRAFT_76534 [Pyrenochaeta sp. MPI-SDFR-AT-0127]
MLPCRFCFDKRCPNPIKPSSPSASLSSSSSSSSLSSCVPPSSLHTFPPPPSFCCGEETSAPNYTSACNQPPSLSPSPITIAITVAIAVAALLLHAIARFLLGSRAPLDCPLASKQPDSPPPPALLATTTLATDISLTAFRLWAFPPLALAHFSLHKCRSSPESLLQQFTPPSCAALHRNPQTLLHRSLAAAATAGIRPIPTLVPPRHIPTISSISHIPLFHPPGRTKPSESTPPATCPSGRRLRRTLARIQALALSLGSCSPAFCWHKGTHLPYSTPLLDRPHSAGLLPLNPQRLATSRPSVLDAQSQKLPSSAKRLACDWPLPSCKNQFPDHSHERPPHLSVRDSPNRPSAAHPSLSLLSITIPVDLCLYTRQGSVGQCTNIAGCEETRV